MLLTDTAPRAISVSVRTRLAAFTAPASARCSAAPSAPASCACAAASFTCPRICDSPTTIESMLAATRKRWRAASSSKRTTA